MIQGGRRQGEASSKPESIQIQKTPLQCWGCGDLHYYKNCPHRTHAETTTHTQEASTVGDVARIIQNINVALDDHQVKYQSAMVEFEGKIVDHSISILIDPGESLIYISPKVVDLGRLLVAKFSSPWLVQLATWTKRRVTAKVNDRLIEIMGIRVKVNLNIFPLGSYDILIGMDWLESYWSLVNCRDKTISFVTEERIRQVIQGIKRDIK